MISKKVVFGSKLCPDCIVMKNELDKRNIKYLYLDITENLANLKKFLKFRENRAFDFAKENKIKNTIITLSKESFDKKIAQKVLTIKLYDSKVIAVSAKEC